MIKRLTNRERQILELAARHLTSKQIGPRLGIRPASVDTFMQTIIRKLGVASRKEAIIAYLATRSVSAEGRDDLDFGSSPMEGSAGPGLVQDVNNTAGPGGSSSNDTIALLAKGTDQKASEVRQAETTFRAQRKLLGSPFRRLIAIVIAALVLGGVTLVAVAVGYSLNRAFDRLFVHSTQSPA